MITLKKTLTTTEKKSASRHADIGVKWLTERVPGQCSSTCMINIRNRYFLVQSNGDNIDIIHKSQQQFDFRQHSLLPAPDTPPAKWHIVVTFLPCHIYIGSSLPLRALCMYYTRGKNTTADRGEVRRFISFHHGTAAVIPYISYISYNTNLPTKMN